MFGRLGELITKASTARAELKNATNVTSADLAKSVEWLVGDVSSDTGIVVTPETARKHSTVFSCIRVLAESVAQLPFVLMREVEPGNKQPAREHPLFDLLHKRPNEFQTAYEWRELQVGNINRRGNSYNYVVRSGVDDRPLELLPMVTDRVQTEQRDDLSIVYHYRRKDGRRETFAASEVLHLRGATLDGVNGITPIRECAETIGVAIGARKFGARMFKNGMTPGGILEHPNEIGEEAQQRLRKQMDERHAGVDNAHKTLLLEEGMQWKAQGINPEDAQMLETMKFSRQEICGIFRVPPHMVMDLERSTNNNIEHQSLGFVIDSLMPWLVRIEQSCDCQLLTEEDRAAGYYFKHKAQGLLRGDTKARGEFYTKLWNLGALNANEIRDLEDMNRRDDPGGDEYVRPVNMASDGGSEGGAAGEESGDSEGSEEGQT